MLTEFGKFLERVRKDRRLSQEKFAALFPLSRTRWSDVVHGRGDSFSVENCFRLAEILDETPSVILRKAGKSTLADLIEHHYGRPITPLQARVLDALVLEDADVKNLIDRLLKQLKKGSAEPKAGSRHGATTARPVVARTKRRPPKPSRGSE